MKSKPALSREPFFHDGPLHEDGQRTKRAAQSREEDCAAVTKVFTRLCTTFHLSGALHHSLGPRKGDPLLEWLQPLHFVLFLSTLIPIACNDL